jgi:16S rRNA (cytosine1402-N4)-methyltransferase
MKKGRWDEPAWNETPEPAPLKPINAKPIEPSEEEIKRNPRSRSALLRVAERKME